VQSGNNVGRVRIDLRDIEINDTNCALAGSIAKDISLRMKDVSATGNGSGFSAGKINATGLTVSNTTNTGGVDGRRNVRLIDSTIEANNGIGVIARKGATLRNSSVTGNADYDVASHLPPHVYSSTCGTSVMLSEPFMLPGPGEPSWGVCSGD
jgi:hypothetical protein